MFYNIVIIDQNESKFEIYCNETYFCFQLFILFVHFQVFYHILSALRSWWHFYTRLQQRHSVSHEVHTTNFSKAK